MRSSRLGPRGWATALAFAAYGAASPLVVSSQAGLPPESAAPAEPPELFRVSSDGHPLAVWARRPVNPWAAVLLVHGRTWSSRPDFDLQVPGLRRSVLASLSARGVAAYAVDLRGYGATARDRSGWTTPERAAADLVNTAEWVAMQHPTLLPPALVGWSRGAAVAMLAAQRAPARVSSIVLFAFAYDPDARFVDDAVPDRPAYARNTAEAAASDFISPAVTPPEVVRAFVDQALRSDPILADWRNEAEFNALDPRRITMPTLVLVGDRDPGIVKEELASFYGRLGSADKQLVLLPGADHAAHIEDTHEGWVDAVVERLR